MVMVVMVSHCPSSVSVIIATILVTQSASLRIGTVTLLHLRLLLNYLTKNHCITLHCWWNRRNEIWLDNNVSSVEILNTLDEGHLNFWAFASFKLHWHHYIVYSLVTKKHSDGCELKANQTKLESWPTKTWPTPLTYLSTTMAPAVQNFATKSA